MIKQIVDGRERLPYLVRTRADGIRVYLNRDYRAIFIERADGAVERAGSEYDHGGDSLSPVADIPLFHDNDPPWRNRHTLERVSWIEARLAARAAG